MHNTICVPLRARAVTNAARTMLMNLDTCQWHEPYLPLFDIPASCLPRIVSNAEVRGHAHVVETVINVVSGGQPDLTRVNHHHRS